MFLTKLSGHIVGLGWDLAAEGPFGAGGGNGASQPYRTGEGRQLYDLAQRDDVDQYVAVVAKADRGEAMKRLLAEGKTSTIWCLCCLSQPSLRFSNRMVWQRLFGLLYESGSDD